MAKNLEFSFLLDFYGDMLTEKQREAIRCYYNDDLSLAEIANNQGITRQGVRDAIKRSETLLYEMEDKLGLVAKFRIMQEGLEKISVAAKRIEDYNKRFGLSKEIAECITEIQNITNTLCE